MYMYYMCISIVRFALYRPYNDMWTHVVHVHVAPGSPPHPQAFYCKIYCVLLLLAQQYGHMYVHVHVCVCVHAHVCACVCVCIHSQDLVLNTKHRSLDT